MKKAFVAASVAAIALAASPAAAKVFLFSYSGAGVSGGGTIVTANTGSPYAITGFTGQANGDAITGLSSYAAADNILYYPSIPYVSFSGIAFSTASSGDWSIGWTGSAYGIVNSLTNPSGACCGVTPLDFQISEAVPEPASWAMMIAGFGMTGTALRRRQSVKVAYAA